jgi:hypothetical protein
MTSSRIKLGLGFLAGLRAPAPLVAPSAQKPLRERSWARMPTTASTSSTIRVSAVVTTKACFSYSSGRSKRSITRLRWG